LGIFLDCFKNALKYHRNAPGELLFTQRLEFITVRGIVYMLCRADFSSGPHFPLGRAFKERLHALLWAVVPSFY
jgi:hypothetical protein